MTSKTITKKQGRPKKTSPEFEIAKSTTATKIATRQKSTTASTSNTSPATKSKGNIAPAGSKTVATPAKPSQAIPTAAKSEIKTAGSQTGANTRSSNTNMSNMTLGKRPSTPPSTPPSTTSTSPILEQVKQVQTIRSASTNHKSSPPNPQFPNSIPQPEPKPALSTSLPFKSLNQSITSRLTTPAGARASSAPGAKPLPKNYQSVARRVTMTIVALPILFVTSWVLWDRLVLGEPKKSLIRDPPVVPGPPMAAEMEARNNRKS
ncbi:hypothetical protein SBOR_4787 [Sclerotinia borealis F-4128]|uniref:Uncharacterized protein n=1 Tax=Sclerotinia borealis (strain F-4128) TaxID=1432307 RepID=W9CDL2_SCLBF|nr:hypothetical protein SBOR_4787 [Sclerotinia borealis F-4128]